MFTRIIHEQFDYDWLPENVYDNYKVTIAGVGGIGAKQLNVLSKKPWDRVCFVDSLTLFDYDAKSSSENENTACREACADCLWLYVGLDLGDECAVESACKLAEYSRSAPSEHKGKSCSCITLKKYYGTDVVKTVSEKFDHVIYVEDERQLFLPAHIMFHPPEYVGIDFWDYYEAMKNCRNIFLFEDKDTNVESLIERLRNKIESTIKQYDIEKLNIFGEDTEDVEYARGLEAHETVMDAICEIIKSIDEEGYFVWNCNFHEDGDNAVRAAVMLCKLDSWL